MLEQNTVTVGNDAIIIESLPATRALQVLTKTLKIVGGLGQGVKDFPSNAKEAHAMAKKIEDNFDLGLMVGGLLENLDEKEHPDFIRKLVHESMPFYREERKSQFGPWYEDRFSRDVGDLFQLVLEIYKWNYTDMFSWISGFFEQAQPQESLPEAGPETS